MIFTRSDTFKKRLRDNDYGDDDDRASHLFHHFSENSAPNRQHPIRLNVYEYHEKSNEEKKTKRNTNYRLSRS